MEIVTEDTNNIRTIRKIDIRKDVKLCVAYPSGEYVHVSFMTSVLLLMQYMMLNGIPAAIAGHQGSRICVNRNALVEMAKKSDSTHILFIDADMVFEPDVVAKLLDHDKDFVCATACKRDGSGKAIGSFMIGGPDKPTEYVKGGLIEAKIIGLPLALIKMSVFDKLKKPYFAEPPLDNGDAQGEDIYFCSNVIASGLKIWCDVDISKKLGHTGTKTYYIEKTDEDAYRQSQRFAQTG